MIVGMLFSLVVVLLSPLASAFPDGLERVAEDLGFLEIAQDSPYSIFADYIIPSFGDSALSTILAGVVGIIVVAGLVIGVGRLVRKPRESTSIE
jgi:cobalt/nickel transport system permease protein